MTIGEISKDTIFPTSPDELAKISDDGTTTASSLPACPPTGSPSRDALLCREMSVIVREDVMSSREETGNQRDRLFQAREFAIRQREEAAACRETACQAAETMKISFENLINTLRQANEQLVISTMQSQIVSEEVRKAQERMGYLAHHDYLTDLPNRVLLKQHLSQAMALAKRHDTRLAVLFVDLDRFKTINDSLGCAVGDRLLAAVAQRLVGAVRGTDTVSRQGGDEFVVLLSEVTDEQAVSAFADKIHNAVSTPYTVGDQEFSIGASIGVSLYPDDGEDAELLIRNADVAMSHGKRNMSDRYHFFRQEMNDRVIERQVIETHLLHALDRQEFALYYQPKVNLDTGLITGAEALLRWLHPQFGLVLPDRFMPIAEKCGLIVPIGIWVLREACIQAKRWESEGLAPISVAVNISAMEFKNQGFVDWVREILRETGLNPCLLQLELTETVLMHDVETSITVLTEIRNLGVQLAMDDFGTGYSSLSYLNRFPIDVLKIDQSFVQGIGSKHDDGIIVSAVISMGSSLKQRVVAEGVELQAQLAFLKALHCDEGQGYMFSRPLGAHEFGELLVTGIPESIMS